jgi:hypothetical protein
MSKNNNLQKTLLIGGALTLIAFGGVSTFAFGGGNGMMGLGVKGLGQSEAVKTALEKQDLQALKTALLDESKVKNNEVTEKINSIDEAKMKEMKEKSTKRAEIEIKKAEVEKKLTDILKADINNKDEFKKVFTVFQEEMKTLRSQNSDVNDDKKPKFEPTKEMIDQRIEMHYTKAVEQVKANQSVTLNEGPGRMKGMMGGMKGQR